MVRTVIQAKIPLPLETVFRHVSQLENMQEYNSSVRRSEFLRTSDDGLPVYRIDVDLGFRKFVDEYRVVELIPNEKIVATCNLTDLRFTDIYIFQRGQDSTYFEITDTTELRGILAMSEFLLGPIMKTQMNANLKTLLRILETRYQDEWGRSG